MWAIVLCCSCSLWSSNLSLHFFLDVTSLTCMRFWRVVQRGAHCFFFPYLILRLILFPFSTTLPPPPPPPPPPPAAVGAVLVDCSRSAAAAAVRAPCRRHGSQPRADVPPAVLGAHSHHRLDHDGDCHHRLGHSGVKNLC